VAGRLAALAALSRAAGAAIIAVLKERQVLFQRRLNDVANFRQAFELGKDLPP